MHHRRRLQRSPDHLGRPLHLQRPRHHAPRRPNPLPLRRQPRVQPALWHLGHIDQMHRGVLTGVTAQPDLLHREHEDRGKPCGEVLEQQVQHGPRRTPGQRPGRVAIQAVLAHVEVKRRQIAGGKGEQLLEHALEIVLRITLPHFGIQLRQPVQQPLLQFRHILGRNPFSVRKPRQIPQQKPHRVAQAAIAVRRALQDFAPDPQVLRVIRLRHPQPQNIRPVFVNHRLGRGRVAQGFGHLHALFIERKPMRQNAPIRCPPLGPAGLQHRRMKPAAMLIGAFKVQVGEPIR